MGSNISTVLKNRRKELGLSVKETLEKLRFRGIDISDKTLYGWESGHRQPDADTFIILCQIYEIESFPNIFDVKKEKVPDTAEAVSGTVSVSQVETMLIESGFIKPGEDLSDDDLRFILSIGEMLRIWFESKE